MFADMQKDLLYGLRRLYKNPAFTAVAVLTLALGIGANTAIFSVVNGVLLKPLPFEKPDRLVGVWASAPGLGEEILPQSPAVHFTYEDESKVIEEIGLLTNGAVTVLGLEEPVRVASGNVTDGTFRALGVQPLLGRLFTAEDDSPASSRTVILGYRYWQSQFGGDPEILGQTININGFQREIVGVMPQSFRLLQSDPALFLPFRFNRADLFIGNFTFRSIARLKDGVTIEQATAELAGLLPVAVEKFPGGMTLELLEEARAAPILRPLREEIVGDVGTVLWVLLGAVGIILIIASANVANLFLVRAEVREKELAVRAAIGADRGQIAGEFLVESILVGMMGGVIGLGLAHGGLRMLVALAPGNLPRLDEVSLDPVVLVFTLGVSVVSGLFFGLFPILRYGRIDLVSALKEGGRGSGSGRERHRARNGLVVAQVALALVLLVGSGLMFRSFQVLRQRNPGFGSPAEVLSLRLTIPGTEIEDAEQAVLAHELIARRLEEVSGVSSVGLSTSITMDGMGGFDPIFVEDFPLSEGQLPPTRRFKWIGAGYFEAMQNPIVAGRSLTWADIHSRARYVLVTENFAREYWDDPAEAVGKRIGTGYGPGNWREILGVVGNVRDDGITQDATAVVYWPMVLEDFWPETRGDALFIPRSLTYVIRSPRVGTPGFLREVREVVWSINSNLPLAGLRTMNDVLQGSLARHSFTLMMLGIAAAVALLLGTVGVYGVIAYVVSQRTRELGVRMVLGAGRGTVIHMVLRQALILAGSGVVIGLGSAYALTRLMSSLLFGISPTDPITYFSVAAVLTAVALLASYLPARRAASMDPMVALREE